MNWVIKVGGIVGLAILWLLLFEEAAIARWLSAG